MAASFSSHWDLWMGMDKVRSDSPPVCCEGRFFFSSLYAPPFHLFHVTLTLNKPLCWFCRLLSCCFKRSRLSDHIARRTIVFRGRSKRSPGHRFSELLLESLVANAYLLLLPRYASTVWHGLIINKQFLNSVEG